MHKLQHETVLITRPQPQNKLLAEQLKPLGFNTIAFPTIEILPIPATPSIKNTIEHLNRFDIAIFISRNAVEYGLRVIKQYLDSWPAHLKTAAIGQATAENLSNRGIMVDYTPKDSFNTEALLNVKALQNIDKKNILIIRGQGGREALASGLLERGASVDYLEVYQRVLPKHSEESIRHHLLELKPTVITASSLASLKNLIILAPKEGFARLYRLPLLVISPAMIEYAKAHGFSGDILLAKNAADQSIMERLIEYFDQNTV